MSVECWNFVFFMVHYSDFIYSFICEIPCLSDSLCRCYFILLKKNQTFCFLKIAFCQLHFSSWVESTFPVFRFWISLDAIERYKNISSSKHKSNNNKFNETNLCNSWIHNLSMMKPKKKKKKTEKKKKKSHWKPEPKNTNYWVNGIWKKRRHTNTAFSYQMNEANLCALLVESVWISMNIIEKSCWHAECTNRLRYGWDLNNAVFLFSFIFFTLFSVYLCVVVIMLSKRRCKQSRTKMWRIEKEATTFFKQKFF